MLTGALSSSQAAAIRWSIAAIFFLNGFVFASWVPHIPAVMERHSLTTGQLGTILLAMAVGAMCALPFAGALTQRFGSRATTMVCAFGFCSMLPLPVLAPTALWTAVALFVFGALNATLDVAMNAQGAELEVRMDRPIMSSLHGGFSLGGLMGAGSTAALLEAGMRTSTHVLMIAALSTRRCVDRIARLAAFAGASGLDQGEPHAADRSAARPGRADLRGVARGRRDRRIGARCICDVKSAWMQAVPRWASLHFR